MVSTGRMGFGCNKYRGKDTCRSMGQRRTVKLLKLCHAAPALRYDRLHLSWQGKKKTLHIKGKRAGGPDISKKEGRKEGGKEKEGAIVSSYLASYSIVFLQLFSHLRNRPVL
jgi:hypothetical protein